MMGAIVGSMGAVVSSMGAVLGSMGAVVGLMEVNVGYGDSIPTRLCLKKDNFFLTPIRKTFRESSNQKHCEGGWHRFKNTDNIPSQAHNGCFTWNELYGPIG